jgi:citrate synthase
MILRMARVPGLIAHIYEEKTRERPMRRIHPSDHEYDGPLIKGEDSNP